MAYTAKNLSVIAYANGFTMWHYITSDSITVVAGVGYFDSAADLVRVGDMIIVNTNTGGQTHSMIVFVTSNHHGKVSVGEPQ